MEEKQSTNSGLSDYELELEKVVDLIRNKDIGTLECICILRKFAAMAEKSDSNEMNEPFVISFSAEKLKTKNQWN